MASHSEEAHYSALRYMKDVLKCKIDAAEPAPRWRRFGVARCGALRRRKQDSAVNSAR